MTQQSDKWWQSMIAKHGSRKAVHEFMKAAQQKSMLNPSRQVGQHTGGFHKLSPEERSKVAKKAAAARWGNREA